MNFQGKDCVLKLKQNLYGLKDGGRTWWEHCSEGLLSMGFKPSKVDKCVYIKDEVVIVCYVDDVLMFTKSKGQIEETHQALTDRKFVFTKEGKVTEYLGICINKREDGSFSMSQPHMLRRIIESIPGLDKENPRDTPAMPTVTLTKDVGGKPRKGAWHYHSVIGMLNFVVQSTHPDVACAVHQCARFCENPKLSHKLAIH